MTPTVTPFEYRGSYPLNSGNPLTIKITAKRDHSNDTFHDIAVEYLFGGNASKEDKAEARSHLKAALGEIGMKMEDLDQKGK